MACTTSRAGPVEGAGLSLATFPVSRSVEALAVQARIGPRLVASRAPTRPSAAQRYPRRSRAGLHVHRPLPRRRRSAAGLTGRCRANSAAIKTDIITTKPFVKFSKDYLTSHRFGAIFKHRFQQRHLGVRTMRKAFAYLRVSGKAQVEGDGFERQLASIEKYAKKHEVKIVQTFQDGGKTGSRRGHMADVWNDSKSELAHRDGLGDLLERIAANGVRLVLVERSDRVARDLMVNEMILDQFRKLEVQVVEVEGGSDLTVLDNEPTKVLIRQILSAVAQFEKSCLVAKLRSARERIRRKQGKCEGRKIFKTGPEVREQIAKLHAENVPVAQIAEQVGISRQSVYTVLQQNA